jgi:hypothetical protein
MSCSVFMFCAPELVFDGTDGVGPHFHVFRFRTRFRRYRGRWVPFACFTLLNTFSAVLRVSGHVFMFCASELVFDDTEGVSPSFHVLRSRTHFVRYRGRYVLFSYFALPKPFWAVPRALGPVFMFYDTRLILGDNEGVRSRFPILRSRTHFRRYRRRRVPFSYFVIPDSFSTGGGIFIFISIKIFFTHALSMHIKFFLPIPYPYPLKKFG